MGEWIDIYCEMPTLDRDVLCFISDGVEFYEMDIGFCWDNPKPRKSKWICGAFGPIDNDSTTRNVTHWMPLPEPPGSIS